MRKFLWVSAALFLSACFVGCDVEEDEVEGVSAEPVLGPQCQAFVECHVTLQRGLLEQAGVDKSDDEIRQECETQVADDFANQEDTCAEEIGLQCTQ